MSETTGRVECLVAEDGRLSSVAIGAERALLDAAELEALIWQLAACRAEMAPRRTAFLFSGSRISLGEAMRVTSDAEGRKMTAIMHPGLGWVGAIMPVPALRSGRPRKAREGRRAS